MWNVLVYDTSCCTGGGGGGGGVRGGGGGGGLCGPGSQFFSLESHPTIDDVLRTEMATLAFLLLELSLFVLFGIDFLSTLQMEYSSEYFDGTW